MTPLMSLREQIWTEEASGELIALFVKMSADSLHCSNGLTISTLINHTLSALVKCGTLELIVLLVFDMHWYNVVLIITNISLIDRLIFLYGHVLICVST